MKIYLARHGQSAWQAERGGDLDGGMTDLGHAQAQRLARWLAGRRQMDSQSCVEVAALYASPLQRAQQTAAYLAATLALPVRTLETLREAQFHVVEHLPRADSPFPFHPSSPPSSSYLAFKTQVQSAFAQLVADAEQGAGALLAVAHGGVIKTMLRIATGSDGIDFGIYNTGLHLLEWRGRGWCLVYLNLLDHLPPRLRTR